MGARKTQRERQKSLQLRGVAAGHSGGAVCGAVRRQRASGAPVPGGIGALLIQRRLKCSDERLSKSKKRSAKAIHSAIKKQLQYIRRDAGYIVQFVHNGAKLTEKQKDRMNLVTTVCEQQRLMS